MNEEMRRDGLGDGRRAGDDVRRTVVRIERWPEK